ncbi:MAG TPA: tyrosine-type recombinase/integrase [Thiobacillaceae bacterium]|nr:tyrosine-type recombinase/integrase [Thiobacillaceae bacterium]
MSFIKNTASQRPWTMRLPPHIPSPAARGNRRRRLVFLGVFALACILSLSYTFLRPAEYRAVARLQITPAAAAPAPTTVTIAGGQGAVTPAGDQAGSQASDSAKPFLTELQVLTSRPVLEQAVERLNTGYDLSFLGPDPVAGLQSAMLITPVSGTDVVVLTITGRHAEVLASLLNTVTQVFQAHLEAAYGSTNHQALVNAGDEAAKLEANVAAKQREVDLFRLRYNIVSPERDENQVLASASGIAASLNKADENVGIAEGKLRSLRDAAASGRNVLRAQDDPTLANLEQRASQLRQDLTDLGRSLTAEFMAMDPAVRAKRAQLEDLERQIKSQRVLGLQAAVAQAEQDLASARETADRIRRQGAKDRNAVREFSGNFDRYKALQADLTEMQALYRAAVERKLRLEASELDRKPAVTILEAATTPRQAWRPLYARDAAISLAGSLLLGLLAMWFVELFNRSEPQPAFIIGQPVPNGMLPDQMEALPLPLAGIRGLGPASPPLLADHPVLPRELRQEEVAALLNAASEAGRLGMLLLLSGMRPEEVLALTLDDVNLEERRIQVAGEPAREIAICETLAGPLAQRMTQPGRQILADAQGHPMTMEDLDSELLCAAHDAGIEHPADVRPAALWHTYIAFLVRQGIRFAELMQISGRLPAGMMAAYSALAPAGSRLPLEAVERVLPAVAQLFAGAGMTHGA